MQQHILLPHRKEALPVLHENIIRIQASSNYSKIYVTNGHPILVSKALCWLETKLPAQLFVRVHRSHLVNKMHVAPHAGTNNNVLYFTNGDTIAMSRRKRKLWGIANRHEFENGNHKTTGII